MTEKKSGAQTNGRIDIGSGWCQENKTAVLVEIH